MAEPGMTTYRELFMRWYASLTSGEECLLGVLRQALCGPLSRRRVTIGSINRHWKCSALKMWTASLIASGSVG